jgi:hypothetical protein
MGRLLRSIFGVRQPGKEVVLSGRPSGRLNTTPVSDGVGRPSGEVALRSRPREWFINTTAGVAEPEIESVVEVEVIRYTQLKPVRKIRLPLDFGD